MKTVNHFETTFLWEVTLQKEKKKCITVIIFMTEIFSFHLKGKSQPFVCIVAWIFFSYALSVIIYSFRPHKVTTDQPEGLQSSVATFVIWVMVSEEVIQQEAGKRLHHQLVIRLVEDKTVGAIQQTDPFCKKKKKKQQCLTAPAFLVLNAV